MSDELIPKDTAVESEPAEIKITGSSESDGTYIVQPEPFVPSPELQAAVAEVMATIGARTFSGRHPELGKMIKCQVCGLRHRENERKCEQKFTNRAGDFEYFKEEDGQLVPLPRTAIPDGEKPTRKQLLGAAQFAKKRYHPHYSKIKLLLIERTRVVYDQLKFAGHNLLKTVVPNQPNTQKSKLDTARIIAARQIRKERRERTAQTNRTQDYSRRINRGFPRYSA